MRVILVLKRIAARGPCAVAPFSLCLAALVFAISALFLQITAYCKPPNPASHGSKTAPRSASAYDPVVLPISEPALRQALIQNSHNAVAEYQSLLRAGYQHQEKNACDTMSKLRREQPNNPVVLDGYFMALRMAQGGINTVLYNGMRQAVIPYDHWAEDDARAGLQRAYRLAPDLWLTYAIDGEDKFHDQGGKEQALVLLQKAERLAPDVPYVHWLLGDAYTNLSVDAEKYRLAAEESKKALASEVPISNAAFTLFQIYSLWLPNQAEEIKWKRKFFSLVPPDVKLNPAAKEWLDRYPG